MSPFLFRNASLARTFVPFYLACSFPDPISRSQTPLLPLISISIPLAETGVSLSAPIWNFFADAVPRSIEHRGILPPMSMIENQIEFFNRNC